MDNIKEKISTKQRVLENAIHLFAVKGYTETSIRELALFVGVKESSIYNHFPSKSAILEFILNEYAEQISSFGQYKLSLLEKNPTAEGILSCMTLIFPEGLEEYYKEELCVILQEQYRNPIVRKFMSEHIINDTEKVFESIISKLKELRIINSDTNSDFWTKTHSSLIYTFSSRFLLGIGDDSPDFSGLDLIGMLRNLYSLMLKTCSQKHNGDRRVASGDRRAISKTV
ncbi:MAG: TetR/AcrR family transcriptional regulator [Synergistaceae bacterium]|nr:TetR/AcrR family transcriptional regulator [Synergistaceae bacterium]